MDFFIVSLRRKAAAQSAVRPIGRFGETRISIQYPPPMGISAKIPAEALPSRRARGFFSIPRDFELEKQQPRYTRLVHAWPAYFPYANPRCAFCKQDGNGWNKRSRGKKEGTEGRKEKMGLYFSGSLHYRTPFVFFMLFAAKLLSQ
jgi:hypothetical protein